MSKKKKKISIREFVSEDAIKFQLYLMKYSNQIKQIEEKTPEEIVSKWNYDTQKKINRFKGDLEKPQFQHEIAQEAIKKNIVYLENLPAPIDESYVKANFENARKDYIKSLELRIKENEKATFEQDKESIEYAKNIQLTSDVSKERFGVLLLLMIKNLRTMPSFSGYSENWADDFYSNAVEKTILYLDNFDEKLLSKRTGQNSKAFAYVTQICFNAFVNIINIRKKESEFLKDTISYETHNFEGVQDMTFKQREFNNSNKLQKSQVHEIIISKKDSIEEVNEKIKNGFIRVKEINELISSNGANMSELDYLKADGNIPEKEKTQDYYDYLSDLESKIVPLVEDTEKTTLLVTVPKELKIENIDYKTDNEINIIITQKKLNDFFKEKKKQKGNKNGFNGYDPESGLTAKQQEDLAKMELEEQELEDFSNEW